jgi:tetratricopeptide (TPR) repeat protein
VDAFIQRHSKLVWDTSQPVVLIAPDGYGVPYIIQELSYFAPLAWIRLEPADAKDAVAIGNKLSDAVTRAVGSQLFGHAMPYQYGLNVLREHLYLLEPLTFALSGAQHHPQFADHLLALTGPKSHVVAAFDGAASDSPLPAPARIITAEELKLRFEDAEALAQGRIPASDIFALWQASGGVYELYLLALNRRLGLPTRLRPGPTRSEPPPGSTTSIDPQALYNILIRRGELLEAAELASSHFPERIIEHLNPIAERYLERGLYQRLWQILGTLSDDAAYPQVLRWKLQTAKRLNLAESLRQEVETLLQDTDAPDIRALYATLLAPHREAIVQSERAYLSQKSFVTLQHYGLNLLQHDPERALEVFNELMGYAERLGPIKRVQAMDMFAPPLLQLGRYHEAATWLEEAIRTFDQEALGDWQLRMHMVNNWSFVRILIGETVGLQSLLLKEEHALNNAFPSLLFIYRSTLGDYFLSQGQPEDALRYYDKNVAGLANLSGTVGVDFPPHVIRDYVHCLLHLGDTERAANLARKHYLLTRQSAGYSSIFAMLAQGMVQSLTAPAEGIKLLEEAADIFEKPLVAPYLASACFYLCRAYLALGERALAQATLSRARRGLEELSDTGFKLLAGPEEAFRDVYTLWRGNNAPLNLTLLGDNRIEYEGEVLPLRAQWCDILVLLTLHPEGLTSEQLLLLLYGDNGKLSNLKASLSKLRRIIPITRPPYTLDCAVQSDFMMIEHHLKNGRLRSALELYRGPLLPHSQAPGVADARGYIEASLREVALNTADPEALVNLAERLKDDLEVWEAALNALPRQDPRYSLVAARCKQLALAYDAA